MEVLIAIGIFALVFGVLYFTLASRVPVAEEAIQRRLDNIAAQPKTAARLRLYDAKEDTFWETVANFFLGDKREIPAAYSKIGRLLHQAAYRGERAIRIFWGLRIFLGLAFSFGGLILAFLFKASTQDVMLLGGVGGVVGLHAALSDCPSESKNAGLGNEGNTARHLGSDRGLCGSGNGR